MHYDEKNKAVVREEDFFNAEKSAVKRVSGQPSLALSGGMSNTPLTKALGSGRNVFIDYLKVRFHGTFSAHSQEDLDLLHPLFNILNINPAYYDEIQSGKWSNFYQYDDGTFIMSSTALSEAKTGASHYLELKGQGCRAFEVRGGSWSDLMNYTVKHLTLVNRIDISLDDTTGLIKIPQLLDRIYKGSFTSDLRTWRTIDGNYVESEQPKIIKSKNDGCTITFGSNKSKQLVIYNKAAERVARRFTVEHSDWIRYEARFYGETAVKVIKAVNEALKNDTMHILVPSLIMGLVDFKEHSINKDKYKLPTWALWEELLNSPEKIKVTNQADLESTLASKQQWLALASGRILAKAFLSNPNEFANYINYCVAQALEKFNHVDLSQVNHLRREMKEPILSMLQARAMLEKAFGQDKIANEYLKKVLKPKDEFDNEEDEDNE